MFFLAFLSLSLPYLSPNTIAPTRPAPPPTIFTTAVPAKSWNPCYDNQPPPHVHAITTGYIKDVSINENAK